MRLLGVQLFQWMHWLRRHLHRAFPRSTLKHLLHLMVVRLHHIGNGRVLAHHCSWIQSYSYVQDSKQDQRGHDANVRNVTLQQYANPVTLRLFIYRFRIRVIVREGKRACLLGTRSDAGSRSITFNQYSAEKRPKDCQEQNDESRGNHVCIVLWWEQGCPCLVYIKQLLHHEHPPRTSTLNTSQNTVYTYPTVATAIPSAPRARSLPFHVIPPLRLRHQEKSCRRAQDRSAPPRTATSPAWPSSCVEVTSKSICPTRSIWRSQSC